MADKPEFVKAGGDTGFEDMVAQDFVAPFLFICQANSPYCLPDNQLYNQEARPGKIINTLSQKVYDSVHVVPVRYKFKNVVWKPRNIGGGFVVSYDREDTPDSSFVSDPLTGRVKTKEGYDVMQTAYYLCLLLEEANDKVIIGMSSTQLKKSRQWNALMQSARDGIDVIPMYATKYMLSTVPESNAKGKWYGWNIQPDGWVQEQLYNMAKEARQLYVDFLPERLLAASRQSEETSSKDTPF
jgi:hypothetical protein